MYPATKRGGATSARAHVKVIVMVNAGNGKGNGNGAYDGDLQRSQPISGGARTASALVPLTPMK